MKHQLIITLVVGFFVVFAFSVQGQDVKETFPNSLHTQAQLWDMGKEFVPLEKLLNNPEQPDFQYLPNVNSNLGFTDHQFWVKFCSPFRIRN